MEKFEKAINYWLPICLWMAIIFTLSSFQAVKSSESYWLDFSFKKLAHMVEYGILWWLNFRALTNTTKLTLMEAGWVSLGVTVGYGLSDEWHQSFVPSRTPAVRDVVFDALGALIVFRLMAIFRRVH